MANPALAPVREPAVAYANANPVRLERAIIERARFISIDFQTRASKYADQSRDM
jgi:hypothetical protein